MFGKCDSGCDNTLSSVDRRSSQLARQWGTTKPHLRSRPARPLRPEPDTLAASREHER